MRTLVIDTETTDLIKNSLQPLERQPRIIELFALSMDSDGNELETFHSFFNPGIKISPEVQNITGINDDMLRNAPFFKVKADEFIDLVSRHDEVVAHNASFDTTVINFEMRRIAKKIEWPDIICTVEATEYVKGHRLNLMSLHEFLFQERFESAHRAENDVRALGRCFIKLRELGIV